MTEVFQLAPSICWKIYGDFGNAYTKEEANLIEITNKMQPYSRIYYSNVS